MALRFTEQHALSLVTPHLFPGEQVVHRARGFEKPWFSRLFFRRGSLFWKPFLVVATNQRLLLLQHKGLMSGYGPTTSSRWRGRKSRTSSSAGGSSRRSFA